MSSVTSLRTHRNDSKSVHCPGENAGLTIGDENATLVLDKNGITSKHAVVQIANNDSNSFISVGSPFGPNTVAMASSGVYMKNLLSNTPMLMYAGEEIDENNVPTGYEIQVLNEENITENEGAQENDRATSRNLQLVTNDGKVVLRSERRRLKPNGVDSDGKTIFETETDRHTALELDSEHDTVNVSTLNLKIGQEGLGNSTADFRTFELKRDQGSINLISNGSLDLKCASSGTITMGTGDVVIEKSLQVVKDMVVKGNLKVTGATTSFETKNVMIKDHFMYLNYTEEPDTIADTAMNAGWVANYKVLKGCSVGNILYETDLSSDFTFVVSLTADTAAFANFVQSGHYLQVSSPVEKFSGLYCVKSVQQETENFKITIGEAIEEQSDFFQKKPEESSTPVPGPITLKLVSLFATRVNGETKKLQTADLGDRWPEPELGIQWETALTVAENAAPLKFYKIDAGDTGSTYKMKSVSDVDASANEFPVARTVLVTSQNGAPLPPEALNLSTYQKTTSIVDSRSDIAFTWPLSSAFDDNFSSYFTFDKAQNEFAYAVDQTVSTKFVAKTDSTQFPYTPVHIDPDTTEIVYGEWIDIDVGTNNTLDGGIETLRIYSDQANNFDNKYFDLAKVVVLGYDGTSYHKVGEQDALHTQSTVSQGVFDVEQFLYYNEINISLGGVEYQKLRVVITELHSTSTTANDDISINIFLIKEMKLYKAGAGASYSAPTLELSSSSDTTTENTHLEDGQVVTILNAGVGPLQVYTGKSGSSFTGLAETQPQDSVQLAEGSRQDFIWAQDRWWS